MTDTKPPFWRPYEDHEIAMDALRTAAVLPAPVSRWGPLLAVLRLIGRWRR